MAKRTFDTNILIDHFQTLRPLDGKGPRDAVILARRLVEEKRTNAILSPVEVEFLCGVLNEHEKTLREAYLTAFRVIDEHRTIAADWIEARRLAKHPGFQSRPRDFGDCLIAAIAKRLKHEILTNDRGIARQRGRTQQRRP